MEKEKKKLKKTTNRGHNLDLSYMGILIFFLFRIPLTNMIGNEGNGYFSIAWEIYMVLGLFFGHGLYHITKNMVQLRMRKKQYHNSIKTLTTILVISIILSLAGCFIIYFSSDIILEFLSMELSKISLRLLGILLIITSVSGVLQGYFEGCGTKMPTCFSKIIGAMIAGILALVFTSVLYKYGSKVGALLFNTQYQPAFGSAGIVIGCILGSIFAFLFLILINILYQQQLKQSIKKEEIKTTETTKHIIIEFLKLSIVVILPIFFLCTYRFVNMVMYIKNCNLENTNKMIPHLGSYHGKVIVLTGTLILVILSITGKNIRKIKKSYENNKCNLSRKYFIDDIKQLIIYSVTSFIIFIVFAKNIMTILYKSCGNTELLMLQIGAINVILIPMAIYFYKILTGLKLKSAILISLLIAFVLQTLCMGMMVKQETLGSLSLIISEVIFWFIFTICELLIMIKTLNFTLGENKNV